MTYALATEFGERYERTEIEELMADSVRQLAGQANVEAFLPVLAYRFTRERLMSLSRKDAAVTGGLDIVFVSLSGGGRAQIAAALTTWLSDGGVSVHAAGTGAQQPLEEAITTVIEEAGIDPAESFARPASPEVIQAADLIVTMG